MRLEALRPGEVGVSAVTEAELLHGAYKSARVNENLAAVLAFGAQMKVLPFDSRVTAAYGQIRSGLERSGQPIGPLDFLIAATAVAYSLVLVTNNVGEFGRVPGLVTEDWIRD